MTGDDLDRLHTFREIDQALGREKGAAFRAFKRLEPALVETRDFHLLRAGRDAALLDALHEADRVYPASINVVLLEPAAARQVTERLREGERE